MLVKNQVFTIKITKANIQHYKCRGYNVNLKDIISVNAEDLTKGSNIKVDVKCDYCGDIIKVVFSDYRKHIEKYGKYSCKHCKLIKINEFTLNQRQDNLYQRALKYCNKMGYELITPKSEIKNSNTRVVYKCPIHGFHETKIYTLITEHKCIDCSVIEQHNVERKSPDDVYNDFLNNGGLLLNKNDYKGWHYKNLKVICNNCGEIFTTSYSSFNQRNGQVCSKCSASISRGERRIKDYMENNNIIFYMEYRFEDCRNINPLPFDFYLPDYKCCIEYDGEQHYQPINRGGRSNIESKLVLQNIQKRDTIKTNYCINNNIKLIRIAFYDYNNIEEILNRELFT